MIRAATETRNIDFKAAMNWLTASKCERFEILKDVAAFANVGGGHLIIGRDEPTYTSGCVSSEQAESFDPTDFNTFVNRYLRPAVECRITIEAFNGDQLIVIEIPEFDSSPLIFQTVGNCGDTTCRKNPHFKPGDLFTRTKAQQSQRVSDPDDMRDILNRGLRKNQDELMNSFQRVLASPSAIEQALPQSPYDNELEEDERDFFHGIFYPWVPHVGHFDLTVRPANYQHERLELRSTPSKIKQYAYVLNRNNVFESIPYDNDHESRNFSGGCRMALKKPEWRRYEGVSLRQSGLYRLVRIFPEDFKPNEDRTRAELVEVDRSLWLDSFVTQMTMLHLLARRIARDLLSDLGDEVQIDLRVDGLAGRRLLVNRPDPMLELRLRLSSTPGSENVFRFPLRTTRRALEVDAVTTARNQCAKILWTFGLSGDGLIGIQRGLLGGFDPTALTAE